MPDIIILGDINVDVILKIPSYPLPGGETVATTVQMHTGGSAVNTAIALANMDMDVGFIGRIGEDALAQQARNDLLEAGVDCSCVQIDNKVSTGMAFIAVTTEGERTMFSARGANSFTDVNRINPDYFAGCRWIHLSGYSFLAYHQYQSLLMALEMAENSPRTRVSLDIGTEPALRARRQIMEIMPRIDVIFPNEIELSLLGEGRPPEKAFDYLLTQGANAIVAKFGDAGSIIAIANQRFKLPAFKINVRDTTGAGDSFNAGVVLGRLVGLSWGASGALGNALGGLASSQEGGALTSLTRNTVAKLVEKHLFREEWVPVQFAIEELTSYFEGLL